MTYLHYFIKLIFRGLHSHVNLTKSSRSDPTIGNPLTKAGGIGSTDSLAKI